MRYTPRAGLALAAAAAATVPAAAAAATAPTAPPGYHRVIGAPILAQPGNFDSGGQVSCPAGTVVWGGGVGFTGGFAGPGENINTSAPTANGWRGRYNNSSTRTDDHFRVDAICAKKPQGYTMTFASVDNPAGAQSSAIARCPTGTVLLSGGSLSTADQVQAALTSAWPLGPHRYEAVMFNGTSSDQSLTAFAVCGKKPTGYAITRSTGTGSPQVETDTGGAQCPARTRIIGGGIQVAHPGPADTLGASLDDPATQWLSEVVNTSTTTAATVTISAICAA